MGDTVVVRFFLGRDPQCPPYGVCRGYRYKALTSQTTKTITARVPISPYPNIVVSFEHEILEFRIRRDPLCTNRLTMYVPLRT